MTTLHLVPHTHWDREWYLTYQQFRLKLVHLMDGLLDLLPTDPNFLYFTLDGQTIILDDYLEVRPERENELRSHIQAGRIVIGPWHVLPDEFLTSPEAAIRNLLQGARTTRRFGPRMMVGYIPDTFGHIGQMPQILRGFGIQTASVMRGLDNQPCEFWWEAPDGSQVLMAYLRDSYGNAADLPVRDHDIFIREVRRLRDQLLPHTSVPHVLLMFGTDHMEPSPYTSKATAATAEQLDGDVLIFSTVPKYLDSVKNSLGSKYLPVVKGELRSSQRHPLLPNVLSSRMWIKQRNHACETLLEKWAEPFSTWAYLVGGYTWQSSAIRQPTEILRHAWRLLMENHPHDSICGCSIDQVHEEMRPRFDQVEQIGSEITRQSLQILAGVVKTIPERHGVDNHYPGAIIVFNPYTFPVTCEVLATQDHSSENEMVEVVDDQDIAIQLESSGIVSQDLFNMVMNRKEFRNAVSMISEGNVAGMALQKIQVRSEGSQACVEVILSETGDPDMAAWQKGIQDVMACLEDANVTTYSVWAHSQAADQLRFCAQNIPGLGWRTYWLRSKPLEQSTPAHLSLIERAMMPLAAQAAKSSWGQHVLPRLMPDPTRRPPFRIENEFFNIEADPDGTLTLTDLRSNQIYHGLNRFMDGGDRGDEYNYAPPETDRFYKCHLKQVRVLRGQVRQTLEISLELEIPVELAPGRKARSEKRVILPITTHASLVKGVPRLDIHTEVENFARDHRLRVHFPATFTVQSARYDGHFEIVERRVGIPIYDNSWIEQPRPEVPQRAFTLLKNGKAGLLIANRGLPEVEVLHQENGNAEIALTLLRCIGWLSRDDFSTRKGHAGPSKPTPGAQMPGKWSFEYAVTTIQGESDLPAIQQAYAFQSQLQAVSTDLHTGSLPESGSFAQIDPAEFIVSTVKASEDGRGWLLRGYNLTQKPINVSLKTWRSFSRVERSNMAEEALSILDTDGEGNIHFTAQANEVVSILFLDG